MNKPKIPVLITGDNQKQHIATEHKKILIDLEVEPCFIYFFDQYNGQYVYNKLLHKGKDTVIDCFNSVKSMLQTLKERQEYMPKGFANALVFAYMGTTAYDEYMYMYRGTQKGNVYRITTNHIDLVYTEDGFVIDDHSVVLLATSFQGFLNNLSMGEIMPNEF